jgi:hypothetical protein
LLDKSHQEIEMSGEKGTSREHYRVANSSLYLREITGLEVERNHAGCPGK